jgi:hypothetical protein
MFKNTPIVMSILLLVLATGVNVYSAQASETSIAELDTFFKNIEDNKLDSSYVFNESKEFFKKYNEIRPEHKTLWDKYFFSKGRVLSLFLIYDLNP